MIHHPAVGRADHNADKAVQITLIAELISHGASACTCLRSSDSGEDAPTHGARQMKQAAQQGLGESAYLTSADQSRLSLLISIATIAAASISEPTITKISPTDAAA